VKRTFCEVFRLRSAVECALCHRLQRHLGWWRRTRLTSLSLLATCLNSLPNEPSGIRTEMVDTIIRSAVVGVVWKRLVETAANHAKDMFDDVEALFHSSQFLAAPEITVSVGKLLVAVNDQGT